MIPPIGGVRLDPADDRGTAAGMVEWVRVGLCEPRIRRKMRMRLATLVLIHLSHWILLANPGSVTSTII